MDHTVASSLVVSASPKVVVSDSTTTLQDSISCKDKVFWSTWCEKFGDLPGGVCDLLADCIGDEALVAIDSVPLDSTDVDPSSIGLLRMPQKFPSRRYQRWVYPNSIWWAEYSLEAGAYDTLSASPDSIGLVPYKFRGERAVRYTLWGWPSPPFYISVQASEEEAEDLTPVVIDCGPVPQEVLDTRDEINIREEDFSEKHDFWADAMVTIAETHLPEVIDECHTSLSPDPPCTAITAAYKPLKEAIDALFAARDALWLLEREHGIPPACR